MQDIKAIIQEEYEYKERLKKELERFMKYCGKSFRNFKTYTENEIKDYFSYLWD
jgi:hypothetical protein